MEVYQDQIRDLLITPNEDGTTRGPSVEVRESPTQGIFLEGVRYKTLPWFAACMHLSAVCFHSSAVSVA